MGPCTYLITASVAGASASGGAMGIFERIKTTYARAGSTCVVYEAVCVLDTHLRFEYMLSAIAI